MNTNLSLSFKITNWCNLHCDHCCERSNKHNKPNFLSLEKIDKYLNESLYMDVRPSNLLTIGGGEAFAPYIMNDPKYISTVLDLVYSYGYIPTLKTNGTWGNNDALRTKILSDIASRAYKYGKLVTLDISVDEFHNNESGVTKIIQDTLTTQNFCYAIRTCLVGFNTDASKKALNSVRQNLQQNGFEIETTHGGDWMICAPNTDFGVYMLNDFTAPIVPLGRAKQTKTYTTDSIFDNDGIDCLQIDNNDYAILNYKYREPIKNRHLNEVLYSLMAHASMQR